MIRLPRISNFTDFSPFERYENVSLRYVGKVEELHHPDLIFLPGTKSTIADLQWLRQSGLEGAILKAADAGAVVFGVCGGYQMLGRRIADPEGAEAAGVTEIAGLGLLEMDTVFSPEKIQTQTSGVFGPVEGILSPLSGQPYTGYEIHMGRSESPAPPLAKGAGAVYGSYIHGLFDGPGVADIIVEALARRKGLAPEALGRFDPAAYKEQQYDRLADAVRAGLDMNLVYRILNREV